MPVINLFDREHIKRIRQNIENTKRLKKSDIQRINDFRGIVPASELHAFFADKIYENVTNTLENKRNGDCNKSTFGTLGWCYVCGVAAFIIGFTTFQIFKRKAIMRI